MLDPRVLPSHYLIRGHLGQKTSVSPVANRCENGNEKDRCHPLLCFHVQPLHASVLPLGGSARISSYTGWAPDRIDTKKMVRDAAGRNPGRPDLEIGPMTP